MNMDFKAKLLILFGIGGAIFVCIYDLLVGRPAVSIVGPRSIIALVICAGLIIAGIVLKKRFS